MKQDSTVNDDVPTNSVQQPSEITQQSDISTVANDQQVHGRSSSHEKRMRARSRTRSRSRSRSRNTGRLRSRSKSSESRRLRKRSATSGNAVWSRVCLFNNSNNNYNSMYVTINSHILKCLEYDVFVWCSAWDNWYGIYISYVQLLLLNLLVGWQWGRPFKKVGVGLQVVMIWLELCTSNSSSCHHHLHHP